MRIIIFIFFSMLFVNCVENKNQANVNESDMNAEELNAKDDFNINDELSLKKIKVDTDAILENKKDVASNGAHCYLIKKNGKMGAINEKGQIVIDPIYQYGFEFYDNVAVISTENGYIVVNKLGEILTSPLNYDRVFNYHDGFAIVEQDGKHTYIDKNGKLLTELIYDDVMDFEQGFGAVKLDNKWGYLNRQGEYIVEPIMDVMSDYWQDNITDVSDGFAFYFVGEENNLINKNGKKLFLQKLESVNLLANGLIPITINSKDGVVDIHGDIITPPIYDNIYPFWNNAASATLKGKKLYLNTSGNRIGDIDFETSLGFSENMVAIFYNEKWGFMDIQGKIIVPFIYSNAKSFKNGMARIEIDRLWGFINAQGKEVIPPKYSVAWDFSSGLGLGVNYSTGTWEYFDEKGNVIIQLKLEGDRDSAEPFDGPLAQIFKDMKIGYINKSGEYVWSLQN